MLTYEQKVDAIVEYLKWRDDRFARYLTETELTPKVEKTEYIDIIIRHILLDAGIRPDLAGFGVLVTALKLINTDSTYFNTLSKRLYPEVGKILGISDKAVSSAIRHATADMGSAKESLAILAMRVEEAMERGS